MSIQDLAALAPVLFRPATPAAFAEVATRSLQPVFGASRAVFADRQRGLPGEMHFVNWPAWCRLHYCAEVRDRDPIRLWLDGVASADAGVARLSELLPARRRRELAREPLLADCGAGFVLTLALRDCSRVIGAFSLVRDAGLGDFDEHDRILALSLLPLLELAYSGLAAQGTQTAAPPPANNTLRTLTPRERQVAELAATGLSNKAIARMLDISPWTVKNQMRAVLDKTGTRNRTELGALLGPRRHAVGGD
ncbi:LuxR family transcriptional regulator [Rhodopseudomonas palustris]|uniref:LuxR family transcriptional regulator n=1 Tax=Rhodopseudomonas palustris TaxID=1076 RepID=A0A418V2E7_RHOPL|nr:LuxR family transcriptional regulator [Rhodopseudomonas palustris]